MGREFRVLAPLSRVYPPAPRPLAACDDESVIGAPFYVMEYRAGLILRRDWPKSLPADPQLLRRMCESLVDQLAELHRVDVRAAGLQELGKPEGYVTRQIQCWTKRYHDAKTDDIPEMDRIADWLAANLPPESPPSLIHNDFKYDNLVLDAGDLTRIVGVLDWEMATVGDPLMDLATALSYWIQEDDPPALQTYTFGPTNAPGSPKRAELLELYAKKRPGIVPDDMRFYFVFALFKNAVVAQQIYARFKRGATKDERFGMMIFGVKILAETARGIIDGAPF